MVKTGLLFNIPDELAKIKNNIFTWNDKFVLAKVMNKESYDSVRRNIEKPRISMSFISIGTNITIKSVWRSMKKLIDMKYIEIVDNLNYLPTYKAKQEFPSGFLDRDEEGDFYFNEEEGYTITHILKDHTPSVSYIFSKIYDLINFSNKKRRFFTYNYLIDSSGLCKNIIYEIVNKLINENLFTLSVETRGRKKVFYLENVNNKVIKNKLLTLESIKNRMNPNRTILYPNEVTMNPIDNVSYPIDIVSHPNANKDTILRYRSNGFLIDSINDSTDKSVENNLDFKYMEDEELFCKSLSSQF